MSIGFGNWQKSPTFQATTASARSFAISAAVSVTDAPQFRSLVVRYRAFDPDERIAYLQTRCYADFVTPKVANTVVDGYEFSADDYVVFGLDTVAVPEARFIDNGAEFWLDALLVSNEIKGGIACDLLTFTRDLTGLTLFLRRKPNQRR